MPIILPSKWRGMAWGIRSSWAVITATASLPSSRSADFRPTMPRIFCSQFFIASNDWQGVYVPEILARGLAPVDWNGYLRQQRRWARSVIDIKLRRSHLAMNNLSLKSRIMSFLHGINYLHRSALIVLMSFLLIGFHACTGRVPARGFLPDGSKAGVLVGRAANL